VAESEKASETDTNNQNSGQTGTLSSASLVNSKSGTPRSSPTASKSGPESSPVTSKSGHEGTLTSSATDGMNLTISSGGSDAGVNIWQKKPSKPVIGTFRKGKGELAPQFIKISVPAEERDEWSDVLETLERKTWEESPIRMRSVEVKSMEDNMFGFDQDDEDEEEEEKESDVLVFGTVGSQVPVNTKIKAKIRFTLVGGEEMTSFKIILRKNLKYGLKAVPSEGTLEPGESIDIKLSLFMLCTTSLVLNVPVIFCHGEQSEIDKIAEGEEPNDDTFVCFLESKVQSRSSTRLDLEDIERCTDCLGAGSYGIVYAAKYHGQDVAYKELKNQELMLQNKSRYFSLFKREVEMLEALHHPCIVTFIGAVFVPNHFALVTELCKFGALDSSISKLGPSVWTPVMKIKALLNCADAMNFLHQSSVMHRDLKPENMLVVSLEQASPVVCKLSDFGTTKGVNMLATLLVTSGCGTPIYMAPEILENQPKYTNKVDVYSFGIMIASIIDDGKTPYLDMGINQCLLTSKIAQEGLRPVVHKEAEMPPALIELMHSCWAHDPNLRPTFQQVSEQLQNILNETQKTS